MSSNLDAPYTRITNDILEEIAKRPFNGSQYAIIITILRNTYGFQRKCHGISLTYIAEATNTNRNQVKRELDRLIEMKVIKVYSDGSYTSSREIGFNKYFSEWQLEDCTLKRVHPSKKSTVREKADRVSAKKSTEGVRELESQERKKDLKEINKEIATMSDDDFAKVSRAYGQIHGKYDIEPKYLPLLTRLLNDGVTADFMIEVMEQRHREKLSAGERIQGFGYYEQVFRDKLNPKVTAYNSRRNVDWDVIKRQLEDAERGSKPGA